MIVLGCDPGLRNTGLAVLEDGKVVYRETIVLPGHGKVPVSVAIRPVLSRLHAMVKQYAPVIACVEQVGWYGRSKRIVIPLSHMAGIITGYLLAHRITTYLLYATQKTATVSFKRTRREARWTEHEKDAAVLARVAWEYTIAERKQDTDHLKKRVNVLKNRIETTRPKLAAE